MSCSFQITNGVFQLREWCTLLAVIKPQPDGEKRRLYIVNNLFQKTLFYKAVTSEELRSSYVLGDIARQLSFQEIIKQAEIFIPIIKKTTEQEDIVKLASDAIYTGLANNKPPLDLLNEELGCCNLPIDALTKMLARGQEKYSKSYYATLSRLIQKVQTFVTTYWGEGKITSALNSIISWLEKYKINNIYASRIIEEYKPIKKAYLSKIYLVLHPILENDLKAFLGTDLTENAVKKWMNQNHPDHNGNENDFKKFMQIRDALKVLNEEYSAECCNPASGLSLIDGPD